MKHSILGFLCISSSDAFKPSSTTAGTTRSGSESALFASISGHEKRTHRPSIAPLSPNTGATSASGPIGVDNPFPANRLPATKYSEQRLHDEIDRLQRTLKERNDDVDTLVYEVYRLRELNHKVKDANEARSNDFTFLKKEAERLKLDFEQRNRQNEERMRLLNERLSEERIRNAQEMESMARVMREKDDIIARLERQVNDGVKTIDDLEFRLKNSMVSPSLGNAVSGRVPLRQYRETKSYDDNKNVARVGGAPIMYRPQKQSGNAANGRAGVADRLRSRAVDSMSMPSGTPIIEDAKFPSRYAPIETTGESSIDSVVEPQMEAPNNSKRTIGTSDLTMNTPARQSIPPTFHLSPIPGKGLGVITTEPIPQGQLVGDYKGEVIDAATKDRRYLASQAHLQTPQDLEWRQSRLDRGQGVTGTYLYGVNKPDGESVYVDAEDEYNSLWTRFINHASPPGNNVDPKSIHETWNGEPRVWFVSNRDIDAGEEICFDYGDDYWLPDDNIA
ncbi:hypothetical protein ACHAW6_011968 [Cyclotella cf. meneghiniana]